MKKRRAKSIILAGLALIFLSSTVSYSAESAGEVLAVKKDVYLIRGNSVNRVKPQMSLSMNDTIKTDKQSRTKLYFTDDSILNIGEMSRVSVKEYLYSAENDRSKSIYELIDGSLRVVVGRSDLEVHTATAVAAARGTKFIMWTKKNLKKMDQADNVKETCIMTLEGKVEFWLKAEAVTKDTKNDRVMVNEGTISCIEGINVSIAQPAKQRKDEWYVAGDIDFDKTLKARAPFGGVDTPDFPEPEYEPEIEVEVDSNVDVEVIFEDEDRRKR